MKPLSQILSGALVCALSVSGFGRAELTSASVWIAAPWAFDGKAVGFRQVFVNADAIHRARWSVSGLGVFDAFVNGHRAGNDFLKPGYTECGRCRHVYEYDVTGLLNAACGATNRLSAVATGGWWCDALMHAAPGFTTPWMLGEKPGFRSELMIEYVGGSSARIGTGTDWTASSAGPVISAGIYEGEVYDARLSFTNGVPAVRDDSFTGELRPESAKIVRREDLTLASHELRVVRGVEGMTDTAYGTARVIRIARPDNDVRLEPGETLIVDFAQNAAALPELAVTGPYGARLTLRFAEMLNEGNGEHARGNDGPAGTLYRANLRKAPAHASYTHAGGTVRWRPNYTFFGYRYMSVETTEPVSLNRIVSIPVSSITREMEAGTIRTGNERVNRLIDNIRWGLLSNYLSVPTDCPQRDERLGWTADTQVFAESAMYLADVKDFLRKYLEDLRDAQNANGSYQTFAPNCRHVFRPLASPGWTDAGILLPYRLWKRYGNLSVVSEGWDSMVRYMDFLDSLDDPWKHVHGDWLAFEHLAKPGALSGTEAYNRVFASFFLVWDAMLMHEMAEALGRTDDAARFAAAETRAREAFAQTYLAPDGMIGDAWKGQACDLYMLKLGLCGDAAARAATVRHLVADIRSHGNRLQTGFLGTAILLPTLTDEADAPSLAYDLLLQDANPSWLYSVDQGATTVWERWNSYTKRDGFGPVAMNSFNHYAYGCVLEWLFAFAAGIRADPRHPGFTRFVLKPYPDARLGFVEASYRSPVGQIRSRWTLASTGEFIWTFSVPTGAVASVHIPGTAKPVDYTAGEYEIRKGMK